MSAAQREGPGPQVFGADYVWREVNATLSSFPAPLCGTDPTRVALIFCSANGGGNMFVTTDAAVTPPGGIGLPTVGYVEITWARHGSLVCAPWYAISGGPSWAMCVIQVFYRPTGAGEEVSPG